MYLIWNIIDGCAQRDIWITDTCCADDFHVAVVLNIVGPEPYRFDFQGAICGVYLTRSHHDQYRPLSSHHKLRRLLRFHRRFLVDGPIHALNPARKKPLLDSRIGNLHPPQQPPQSRRLSTIHKHTKLNVETAG